MENMTVKDEINKCISEIIQPEIITSITKDLDEILEISTILDLKSLLLEKTLIDITIDNLYLIFKNNISMFPIFIEEIHDEYDTEYLLEEGLNFIFELKNSTIIISPHYVFDNITHNIREIYHNDRSIDETMNNIINNTLSLITKRGDYQYTNENIKLVSFITKELFNVFSIPNYFVLEYMLSAPRNQHNRTIINTMKCFSSYNIMCEFNKKYKNTIEALKLKDITQIDSIVVF